MKRESLVWFYIVTIALSVLLMLVGSTLNDAFAKVCTICLGISCTVVASVHLYIARR